MEDTFTMVYFKDCYLIEHVSLNLESRSYLIGDITINLQPGLCNNEDFATEKAPILGITFLQLE